MNVETMQKIRNAEISNRVLKLSITEQKAIDQIRAYVELMQQQRKNLNTVKVAGSTLSAVMKALNAGLEPDQRFTGATYKGFPLEAVHG